MSATYSVDLLLKAIPQRYPFLMVDRIVSHEFRQKAVCKKNVTLGEEVFTGHFPENPIYPGVMMIEMGLQTTQIMLTDLEKLATAGAPAGGAEQGFLLMVEKFKFSSVVRPGDVVEITSELQQEAMGMIKAKIRLANQDGQEIAQGTVTVGGQNR